MNRALRSSLSFAFLIASLIPALAQTRRTDLPKTREKLARLPLYFVPDQPRAGADAAYMLRGGGIGGELHEDGVDLMLPGQNHHGQSAVIRFLGTRRNAIAVPAEPLAGHVNSLLGNEPAKWRRNLPTYGQVRYEAVYPGIDVLFYGHNGALEHDFIVQAGARPEQIAFAVTGTKRPRLRSGAIEIPLDGGSLVIQKPRAYQERDGKQREVQAHYIFESDGSVHVRVGHYDRRRPLVIDPVLDYATYLDTAADYVEGIATDAAGDTFITGLTFSASFPTTPGAFQRTCSGCNDSTAIIFVTKLNPAGTAQVYSTLLGGSLYNQSTGIGVDANGNAIVTGYTWSEDYPVKNSVQSTTAGNNQYGIISSLTADGSGLNYSSIFGAGTTYSNAIAVDAGGNAYITGITDSSSFPTTGGALKYITPQYPDDAAFVTKFTPAGALAYSAILGDTQPQTGGGGLIGIQAIAVDSAGSAYVTGGVGTAFPTTSGVYNSSLSSSTYRGVVVAKLHPDGSKLDYSTFIGPGGGLQIALDSQNNAWIGGTADAAFPTTLNAYSTTYAAQFLSKISADGTQLLYSSYFPGAITSLRLDSNADVWLAGSAGSNFPLLHPLVSVIPPNPMPSLSGGPSSFLLEFDPTATQIKFSTYIGDLSGSGLQIVFDPAGKIHAAGTSVTPIYVSPGAFLTSVTTPPNDVEYTYPYSLLIDPIQTNPAICFSGTAAGGLTFPIEPLQTAFAESVQITNCGDAPLTIHSVTSSDPAFSIPAAQNTCTSSIDPAATCTLQVVFTPTAAQTYSSNLAFSTNSSIPTTSIPLSGRGGIPVALFGSTPVFYPLVVGQTSTPEPAILINHGTVPMTVDVAHIAITGDFALAKGNVCQSPVGPGGSCTFSIAFTPTAAGTRTGTLTVPTNDPVNPVATLNLSGTAYAAYPVPTVTYVVSPTFPVNSGKVNVQVFGTNFFPASVISLNGNPQPTTFQSNTYLTFTLDTSLLSATSTVPLTVSNPTPGGGVSAPFALTGYFSVPLSATALVADPVRDLLYAAIPSTASQNPATVIPIDATTGKLGTPIAVASSPRTLAVSADGAYLYVGGSSSLQRINLATLKVDRNLPLPTDPTNGQTGVSNLQVVPGSSQSVVASLDVNRGYNPAGEALFSDSSMVNWIGDSQSTLPSITSFTFAGSASQLYAFPVNGSFFSEFQVSPSGLVPPSSYQYTVGTGPFGNQIASDGTYLYTDWPQVWDPSTQKEIGTFTRADGSSFNWVASIVPDATGGRIFLLDQFGSYYEYQALVIDAYKSSDRSFLGSLAFTVDGTNSHDLVRWGADGFAFRVYDPLGLSSQNDQIVIFHSALAGATSAPVPVLASISPSSVNVGSSAIALSVTGSGFTANSTVQVNGAARTTTYVSATELQTSMPATDFAAAGNLSITVTTPAPGGGTSTALPLAVVPTAPLASLSAASLSFGNVTEGTTSAPQTVTLTNSGNAALAITSLAATGDYAVTSTCGSSLAAGKQCSIAVAFTPSAAGGRSGNVTLIDNAHDSPQTINLSGTGVAPVSIGAPSGGSTSATVTSGGTAHYGLALTGSPGFNGSVSLACTGAPQYATCTVTPSSLTLASGTPASITVTVTTSTQSGSLRQSSSLVLAGFGIFVLLTLPLLPGKAKRARAGFSVVCAATVLFSISGCGGGSKSTPGGTGGTVSSTPPGTYSLTVTASAGSASVTQNLTLTVQ